MRLRRSDRLGRRLFRAVILAGLAASPTTAGAAVPGPHAEARHELANRCHAVQSVARQRFVAIAGEGYRATARGRARAAGFFLKPTGLRTYFLYDEERKLVTAAGAEIGRGDEPGEPSEWAVHRTQRRGVFGLRQTVDGRRLAVGSGGALTLSAASATRKSRFRFARASGCTRYPEAGTFARGRPPDGVRPNGKLFGFADMHVHLTAELRAGGRVIHGGLFDRFGITRALSGDEADHGPDGSLDVTGNLLRSGVPIGTHDTNGWPTFTGWPVHDTYTHQQVYYGWLKRAWKAGERLAVAQTVEDEPLCELEPLRSHSCDEMDTVELQVRRLRGLETYVDAQSGGRGRGWLRVVRSPRQARRVIARGKLAVLIGVEASSALGCKEFLGQPQCDEADIDQGLDRLERLGVSSLFIAHWVDNAFAGAALQSGATGTFISGLQLAQTGHPFATASCTGADEAAGQCNQKGLTALGRYLIEQLMDRHMLIEVDHLSQLARESVLDIAAARRYPVVSSHTGTGGEWTPAQLRRLYALGGMPAARPDQAPELADRILELWRSRSRRRNLGVGLGTDTGGFNELPAPRANAAEDPLRYPFRPLLCNLKFRRQRTGGRTYDLNTDGVAHYGLFADLLADVQRTRPGRRALHPLYRSADAYLRMWRRTGA